MTTIEIEYTCKPCGVHDAKVQVRARWPAEDVSSWMNTVGLVITTDHRRRSPMCDATHITHAKIPLPAGGGRVGDPTAH